MSKQTYLKGINDTREELQAKAIEQVDEWIAERDKLCTNGEAKLIGNLIKYIELDGQIKAFIKFFMVRLDEPETEEEEMIE